MTWLGLMIVLYSIPVLRFVLLALPAFLPLPSLQRTICSALLTSHGKCMAQEFDSHATVAAHSTNELGKAPSKEQVMGKRNEKLQGAVELPHEKRPHEKRAKLERKLLWKLDAHFVL